MKQPPTNPSRFSHLRNLVARFAFLALVGATFILMLVGKADTFVVERVRTALADMVTPVMEAMAHPAAAVAGVVQNVRELAAVREENARLRAENANLLRWQAVARHLEAQNDSLRDLLNFVPEPRAAFVTARVVADTGGAFAHSLLVTAGTTSLVEKGQAVMAGEGLVGRIAEAGRRASRVLLVTDINSRIPVVVGNGRHKAILAGDNSDRARLLFLKTPGGVVPGDRVSTSGDDGAFPPDLPVGVVTSVDDGEVRVEPFLRRDRLEYVRIVDYGLSGILRDVEPGAGRPSDR